MKRYIFAAIALIGLAGTVTAQKDITSTYITNATLANGTTGWTVSNFNTPQQGNHTIGYASEAYAGWGNLDITSYSLTQNITLPKGSYRLVNYSFFRQGLRYNTDASKSLAYLKAGSQQVAIKTLGSVSGIPTDGDNGGYANSQSDGANCFDSKMYRNVVEFTIDADNTTIEIGITGTFDLKQSWCIAGMFELFDMEDLASVSSPTDVTYAITNSSFEYRNLTGWTNNGMIYQNNSWEKKVGIGFVEKWQENPGLPNATLTQQLTGLPNGLYELAVNGHNINQKSGNAPSNGFYLTAGTAQKEIGAYGEYKVRATVTDGTLQIGLKLDDCTGNWVAADRFSLLFYGDPDAAVIELINTYINEANGLLTSTDAQYLTASQKDILQQAVSDAQTATSENRNERMETLVNAIETARQQIQQVKDNRALLIAALERFENDYNFADGTDYSRLTMSEKAWTDLLDAVNTVSTALDDVSQAASYGTLKDALVAQMDATDTSLRLFKSYKAMVNGVSGTVGSSAVSGFSADGNMDSDATEQTAIDALNTAFDTFAATQDAEFDVSAFLGANLDFSAPAGSLLNGDNSNTIKAVTGWEVAYADADTWSVIQTDQSANEDKLYMRKNWGSAATTLTVSKSVMLPVGKYSLTFWWDSKMENMTNLSAYKLGNTPTAIGEATTTATKLTYDFEVTSAATPFDLTFGFKRIGTDNSPAQIIVDNVALTYTPTLITLSDNASNAATIAANDGNRCVVTLSGRTLYKDDKWNTLCLPFDATLTGDLADATLMELDTEGSYGGHTTGLVDKTLYLNFKEATTIRAGVPYIIKWAAGTGITDPKFTGVTVTDGTPASVTSTDSKVVFQGLYSPVTLEANNKSLLFLGEDNKLFWPSADTSVGAFRAYFRLNTTDPVRQFVLNFGDEATAINDIAYGSYESYNSQLSTLNSQLSEWHSLDGRQLDAAPTKKGIYIRNGRKVVIK